MTKPLILAIALFAAGQALAAPVAYEIDPGHTNVIASWNHLGFSNPVANFHDAQGTIVYDADNVGQSSVNVTLPMTGLATGVPKFDEHLRSADFFDAEKFPTITFRSNKVEAAGEKKLRVFGDLTVHGVTKPAVLDVTLNKAGPHPMTKREAIGFDATTTLKRSDFGVDKNAPYVSDEVTIRITTEAMVAKAGDTAK